MSYFNRVKWTVIVKNSPKVRRNCSKCGRQAVFINSEKFRVNANKSKLDIWLIYQCEKCKSTWNMAIYERIAPKDLDKRTYQQFLNNDQDLAQYYGLDRGLLGKNGLAIDEDSIVYEVEGSRLRCIQDAEMPHVLTGVEVVCEKAFPLRIDKLLSHQLGISRSHVKRLYKAGIIAIENGQKSLNDRIQQTITVAIKTEKK